MTKRDCRGLTLVELMIGLALSLLILGAAVSVFMGTKETFRLEEDVSALQENYRFIADRISKDMMVVGYSGCASPFEANTPAVKNLVTSSDASAGAVATGGVIEGVEGGPGGSDSISIGYAKTESAMPIVEGGANPTSPVYVSQNHPLYLALADNFASGSAVPVILMVGNCDIADLFLVTGVETVTAPSGNTRGSIKHETSVSVGDLSNTDADLSFTYGRLGDQSAIVYSRSDVTYEIDTVGGVTGLYETRDGGGKQLLLDNVTDMQIQYGIDSPSDPDRKTNSYQDWDSSLEVSDITSLKITLSMVVTQQKGVDVTRDYSFTIKMRDMGL
jgi:type IV pilus assembly protein PilW